MTAVEGLLFPDTREVLFGLIDGEVFAGRTARAFFQLPVDFTTPRDGEAMVLVYTSGGTQGWVDRVDRATVEVYAPGTDAVAVAEAIRAAIVGDGLDTAEGYVDSITCDITPHDVPFQSEAVNLARAGYLVTSRPL